MISPVDIRIVHDPDEIKILDDSPKPDTELLSMRLDQIRSETDLRRWRGHNVAAALYIANFIRKELFAEGTPARDLFLSGNAEIPNEMQEAMTTWDQVTVATGIDQQEDKSVEFSIDLE